MQIKEDLMYYDFQGWPVFKMNIKEILEALGGKIENNKIVFELNDPIMEVYPTSYIDDGMAYGVEACKIIEVSRFEDNGELCVNFFRKNVPNPEHLKELYNKWDEQNYKRNL